MKLRASLLSLIVLLISTVALGRVYLGRVYYVDGTKGNDTLDGLSETTAWKTIYKANKSLNPGDTVLIIKGIYYVNDPFEWKGSPEKQGIRPGKSGTQGKPIVYMNYNNDSVAFIGESNRSFAVNLESRSYIVIKGLQFTNMYQFMWILNGNHNEIAYCSFQKNRPRTDGESAIWRGSTIYKNSQHNHIHHCTFSHYGDFHYDSTLGYHNDQGALLEIGNEEASDDFTSYNLIEDCHIFAGAHHTLGIAGIYNVIRNNYIHNENWWLDEEGKKWGNRILAMQTIPSSCNMRNLIEGNRIAFGGETKETVLMKYNLGGSGIKLVNRYNIFRKNMFYYALLYAIYFQHQNAASHDNIFNHVYNNVFFHNGYSPNPKVGAPMTHAIYLTLTGSNPYEHNYGHCFQNNIFYDNCDKKEKKFPIIGIGNQGAILPLPPQYYTIANNWEEKGNPKWMYDGSPLTPFGPQPDFHLFKGSPCIDSGGFLTSITSADGSGTRFQVKDAGYFMDGWGIEHVQGDEIQLQGQKLRARIEKIDYNSNIITVNKTVKWTQGIGIALPYENSAPDIGAYEYDETVNAKETNDCKKLKSNPQINIHYHPSQEKITFFLNNNSSAMHDRSIGRIYNFLGILIDEFSLQSKKYVWNISSVSKGFYLIKIECTGISPYQKTLIIW